VTLYQKLSFNVIRDIVPVASISRETYGMKVHPSFPTKTVAEFITYAQTNPGKINMASAGNRAGPHVAGELFGPLVFGKLLFPRSDLRTTPE
jgi:tripartite-type tricarboxylate transporter receptor subunit TctC